MVSLATQTDRTLFFDFLPLDLGTISGFTTKFQLYTVPGQVYYQTTRKLVLQGADGVVFVADSQARQLDENIESFQDLHANLAEQGIDPRTMPLVVQYNKQDLPKELILPVPELSDAINFRERPGVRRRRAPRARRVRDAARHLRDRAAPTERRRLAAGRRRQQVAHAGRAALPVRQLRRRLGQPTRRRRGARGRGVAGRRVQPAVHLRRVGARQDAPHRRDRQRGGGARARAERGVPLARGLHRADPRRGRRRRDGAVQAALRPRRRAAARRHAVPHRPPRDAERAAAAAQRAAGERPADRHDERPPAVGDLRRGRAADQPVERWADRGHRRRPTSRRGRDPARQVRRSGR